MTDPNDRARRPRIPYIRVDGPTATHDQACAVCHIRPAVYHLDTDVFQPCWECQSIGYRLRRIPRLRLLRRFLRR